MKPGQLKDNDQQTQLRGRTNNYYCWAHFSVELNWCLCFRANGNTFNVDTLCQNKYLPDNTSQIGTIWVITQRDIVHPQHDTPAA